MSEPDPRYPHTPLDQCEKGRLYIVWARNFNVAIYDGNGGFIGVRQKFKSRFLFVEYH